MSNQESAKKYTNYNHNGTFLGGFDTLTEAYSDGIDYTMNTENTTTIKCNGKVVETITVEYINSVMEA